MALIDWTPRMVDQKIEDLRNQYNTMNNNTDQLQSEISQLAQQSRGQWAQDWNAAYKVIDQQQSKMHAAFQGAIQKLQEMKENLVRQDLNNQIGS
ncbi:hypothetical protein [Saccharopolyspora rosea]|uniref:ESAT-6-like protein n=1 Tax=Saccharopolyspora rosea TaxID=524884 RepID=A0ABW3FIM2_9PSEU|nr:hypothetical protein [Saccharopolyspora rosea]